MKRPPAIFAAIVLLAYFAVNLAFIEYRTQQPSRYLIGGYRGAALLCALAALLFFFPRMGRWFVGVFFSFAALVFLPSAIKALAIVPCVVGAATLLAAIWLFRTKIPRGSTKAKTEA